MAGRIWIIDAARTLALLGMVVFHLCFDLQMYGYLPPGTTQAPALFWLARIVAGGFLFLAGASLWLGHGNGIRWHAFWQRWLRIAAAAALVSLATRIAMPQAWVFYGILHSIAVASLLGLAFLRLPPMLTIVTGAAVMAASYHLPQILQWNAPALRWVGLANIPTQTIDFEPLFPWFGPFLLGLGTARLLGPLWPSLAGITGPRWLAWPGRHSLAIYLLHQPILLGAIWLIGFL